VWQTTLEELNQEGLRLSGRSEGFLPAQTVSIGMTQSQASDAVENIFFAMETALARAKENKDRGTAPERNVPTAAFPPYSNDLPRSVTDWRSRISYSDVPGHVSRGPHPSEERYATALFDANNAGAIVDLANRLRAKLLRSTADLGLDVSDFARSESWALWDIGKQLYLFNHPRASSEDYRLANPLTDLTLQQEIVDRMLGWEFLGARAENVPSHQLTATGRWLRLGVQGIPPSTVSHVGFELTGDNPRSLGLSVTLRDLRGFRSRDGFRNDLLASAGRERSLLVFHTGLAFPEDLG
jgi:hypothetical protein